MRIVLVNKFYYNRGGDCIHTITLKELLEKNGHNVAVFSMQYPKNFANEFEDFWPSEVNLGIKTIKNSVKIFSRTLFSSEVKRKWILFLDHFKPDIVHLHNIHTYISPIIAQIAYKRKIPVFWTMHDYKLMCPAYLMLRNKKTCESCKESKWAVVNHKCIKGSRAASLLSYFEALRWNKNALEKYTNSFIAPSLFLKNKMIEFGFSPFKINNIRNFIPEYKLPNLSNENRNDDYFLYVGRLSEEKGIETLLRAFSRMSNFKLKVIGDEDSNTGFKQTYSSFSNIEFLGFREWDIIELMLKRSHSLIVPSECYDNNPLTVIESLVQGTPVIGANIGGIPELIDSTNGLLFEAGNVDDLIQKVQMMYHKVDWDYQKISEEAVRKFSEEVFYKKLTSIYEQFVSV